MARPEPPRKSPSPVLMKNSSGLFGAETQTPSARRLSAPTERRGVPAAISSTPRGAGIAGAVGRPASVGVGAVVGIPGTCPLVPGAFASVPGAFVGAFFGVALTDLAAFVAAFAPAAAPFAAPLAAAPAGVSLEGSPPIGRPPRPLGNPLPKGSSFRLLERRRILRTVCLRRCFLKAFSSSASCRLSSAFNSFRWRAFLRCAISSGSLSPCFVT